MWGQMCRTCLKCSGRAHPGAHPAEEASQTAGVVTRVKDGLNVNVRLVAVGAAAPYFYRGPRGRLAAWLEGSRSGRGGSSSACGPPGRRPL